MQAVQKSDNTQYNYLMQRIYLKTQTCLKANVFSIHFLQHVRSYQK